MSKRQFPLGQRVRVYQGDDVWVAVVRQPPKTIKQGNLWVRSVEDPSSFASVHPNQCRPLVKPTPKIIFVEVHNDGIMTASPKRPKRKPLVKILRTRVEGEEK